MDEIWKYNEIQWSIDSHTRWLKSENAFQKNRTLSSGLFFFCTQRVNRNSQKKNALDLLHKAKQNQVMMKTMMYKKDGFVFVILRINLLKTVRKQQLWSSHFFHFFLQNTLQHQQSKDSTLNAKYARFFKPGRDPEKSRKRAL